MDPTLKKTSKFVSLVLRHQPEIMDLDMDDQGWVPVNQLLLGLARHGHIISLEALREIVRTNDKQRFAFSSDEQLIRANQGHSLPVDLGLPAREPPNMLYHGTALRFVPAIRRDGLDRRQREHVHLAADEETAWRVGQRHGKPIVLTIAAAQMFHEYHRFYLSQNGVWLTDAVPPHYIDFPS